VPTRHKFRKTDRLLSSPQFLRVFKGSVFAADDVLVIKAIESETGRARLGLTISKKVGNAVVRNRWKRLLREVFRQHLANLPPADFVIRPKKGAQPDYAAIHKSLPALAQRIGRKLG
jgi:ribonuclease P protein component